MDICPDILKASRTLKDLSVDNRNYAVNSHLSEDTLKNLKRQRLNSSEKNRINY
jgi:hypothetical protein